MEQLDRVGYWSTSHCRQAVSHAAMQPGSHTTMRWQADKQSGRQAGRQAWLAMHGCLQTSVPSVHLQVDQRHGEVLDL